MNKEQIDNLEKVQSQLDGLFSELAAFSKKTPNDAVNKFKLKFINKVLDEANSILTKKYQPFDDFEKFHEDDLPTASDVVLILSQYLNCMEKLRADNISVKQEYNGNKYVDKWYWIIKGNLSDIETGPPKKLNK